MKKCLLISLIVALTTSCSIKEDRMQCPTYISIQANSQEPGYAFYFSEGKLEHNQRLTADQLQSGDNRQRVTKGNIDIALVSGIREDGGMILTNGYSYYCPQGNDADPIYTFVESRYVEDDAAHITGTLLKQFAHVDLTMKNGDKGEAYPYRILIRGEYGGVDIYHAKPMVLPFVYEPQLDEANRCEFNLNRQGDDSLVLELYEKGDDGELVDTISLGYYIAQTGYSWTTEILGDIRLQVDYARAQINISINDWDEGITFSLVI